MRGVLIISSWGAMNTSVRVYYFQVKLDTAKQVWHFEIKLNIFQVAAGFLHYTRDSRKNNFSRKFSVSSLKFFL